MEIPSSTAAAGGSFEPGLCIVGCSGAMDVAFELVFVALAEEVNEGTGDAVRVGWLVDLCGSFRSCSSARLRGVVGLG
jgi:hypothetical protein